MQVSYHVSPRPPLGSGLLAHSMAADPPAPRGARGPPPRPEAGSAIGRAPQLRLQQAAQQQAAREEQAAPLQAPQLLPQQAAQLRPQQQARRRRLQQPPRLLQPAAPYHTPAGSGARPRRHPHQDEVHRQTRQQAAPLQAPRLRPWLAAQLRPQQQVRQQQARQQQARQQQDRPALRQQARRRRLQQPPRKRRGRQDEVQMQRAPQPQRPRARAASRARRASPGRPRRWPRGGTVPSGAGASQ